MQKDLHNRIAVLTAIAAAAAAQTDNTPLVSAIIDTNGFDSLEFAITSGTLADADVTVTPSLTEGDAANLSDGSAVAAADLLGTVAGATFAASDDGATKKIGYRGTKRYVKLTLTPANNTGALPMSAVAILGHARHGPVA